MLSRNPPGNTGARRYNQAMAEPHVKHASVDHDIHELIAKRWSPYVFDSRAVEPAKLLSCLEAARWAASSFNEQPWSFIVATRQQEQAFATMVGCLMEANQAWAQHAGVLIVTVVCKQFSRNNEPNRVAEHDLGLAVGNMTLQATALGLSVHQMAGINASKLATTYKVPDTHATVTAIALGYAGDGSSPGAAQLAQRDQAPRSRKPLNELVFADEWGQTAGQGQLKIDSST